MSFENYLFALGVWLKCHEHEKFTEGGKRVYDRYLKDYKRGVQWLGMREPTFSLVPENLTSEIRETEIKYICDVVAEKENEPNG